MPSYILLKDSAPASSSTNLYLSMSLALRNKQHVEFTFASPVITRVSFVLQQITSLYHCFDLFCNSNRQFSSVDFIHARYNPFSLLGSFHLILPSNPFPFPIVVKWGPLQTAIISYCICKLVKDERFCLRIPFSLFFHF